MAIDARIVRTKDRLRDALVALVAEKRLDEVTVSEIATRAEVGYATFFRHYSSKIELWQEIADGLTTEFLHNMAQLVGDADSRTVAEEVCAFVDANRARMRSVFTQGAEGQVREDLVARATALADRAAPRSIGGLPRDLALRHSTSAAIGVVIWWMEHEDEVSVDQMVDILDRLVVRPVREG